jgi:DNA repair exonuclease SbcCD nuclease subunit
VGDPHVTINNISQADKLIEFVVQMAQLHKVERIEFMGDLFHTHAAIRVEVLDFWRRTFAMFEDIEIQVVALVGNHDQPGSKEKEQKMSALDTLMGHNTIIVNSPRVLSPYIAYIPHMSDEKEFLRQSQLMYEKGVSKCLVAHQTFTGAQYENGFYAPDGIDPALVAQESIISGHIHKSQQVGKCFYTGTAKWDSMSDANEDKGIWIFEHREDGSILSKNFISTKEVVTPIYKHTVNEGEEMPQLVENAKNYVELIGTSAWIKQIKKQYKGLAQIKARPVDRKMVKLDREKTKNIFDFLNKDFVPLEGIDKNDIVHYLKEEGFGG